MIEKSMLELLKIKKQKEKESKKLKEINEKEEYLEQLIISEMRKEGLEKASIKNATATISTKIYPKIENWDKVLKYIIHMREFTLLKKQVNNATWRELESKVPGISEFEKSTLLFRRK